MISLDNKLFQEGLSENLKDIDYKNELKPSYSI